MCNRVLGINTVNYVIECLNASEIGLAESAILEQDNGLSEEHKDVILKLIQEMGEDATEFLAYEEMTLSALNAKGRKLKRNEEQTLILFPKLRKISLDRPQREAVKKIAQAIPKTCPFFTTLQVSHSFHSKMLEPFKSFIQELDFDTHVSSLAFRTLTLATYPKLESLVFRRVVIDWEEVAKLPIKRLKITEGINMSPIERLADLPQLERLEVTNLTWQRLEKIQNLLKAKGTVSQTTTTVLLGERQIPIEVIHGEIPSAEYILWSRPRREYEELTFTLTLTKPAQSPPKV